jgi:hypothetical protein
MIRSMVATSVALLSVAGPLEPCARTACVCSRPGEPAPTPAETVVSRRDRASVVALGTVMRIDTLPSTTIRFDDRTITLRRVVARVHVERVWRGTVTDTVSVLNTHVELKSSCELGLELGESYVIFATRRADGLLATTTCSGTVEQRDAAFTINVLDTR